MTALAAIVAPSAIDVETRQALTEEQIQLLKEGGGTANDVVAKLVAGSASFATRTTHAKSKYIRRKTKKHSDRVLILKPNIRLLCEAYLRKDYDRAGCLRIDQLSLILHQGAVHTGRRVLVFDQVLGLITAAVTERLGGSGACIHLHRGTVAQSIPCFNSMEFSPEVISTFYPVRIECILEGAFKQPEESVPAAAGGTADVGGATMADVGGATTADVGGASSTPEAAKEERMDTDETTEAEGERAPSGDKDWGAVAAAKRAERMQREADGLAAINEGVDSILIGTRSVDPVSILELVWPKLRPSGNVVVYSPTIQHVCRAQQWLRNKGCVHIMLSDQMYRIQQVLPDRTHPLMSQMVVGGYVLAAIKVLPVPATTA